MERKLISQGKGGHTVYLPKKWVDRKGLTSGSTIIIEEHDQSLLIKTTVQEKKELSLSVREVDDIFPLVTHAYRNGYDTIRLSSVLQESVQKIRELCNSTLIGFEVTSLQDNVCVLENISEPTESKYDVLKKRVFFIIKEMIVVLIEDVNEQQFQKLDNIKEMRLQVDKFVLFCRRMISKEYGITNSVLEWELFTFLTHISHAIHYLYEFISQKKPALSKTTISLLKKYKDYFDYYYSAVYTKNINYIHNINTLKKSVIFGECFTLLKNTSGDETIVVSMLRELYRLTQIGTSPILASLIQQNFE